MLAVTTQMISLVEFVTLRDCLAPFGIEDMSRVLWKYSFRMILHKLRTGTTDNATRTPVIRKLQERTSANKRVQVILNILKGRLNIV